MFDPMVVKRILVVGQLSDIVEPVVNIGITFCCTLIFGVTVPVYMNCVAPAEL